MAGVTEGIDVVVERVEGSLELRPAECNVPHQQVSIDRVVHGLTAAFRWTDVVKTPDVPAVMR
jgi:hypothetical protein